MSETTRRQKNIAVLAVSGAGAGDFERVAPAYVSLIEELSTRYRISSYSRDRANRLPTRLQIELRNLPRSFRLPALEWHAICARLCLDHLTRRFTLIHALGGGPAGRVGVKLAKLLSIPSVVTLTGEELANLPDIAFGHLRADDSRARIAWVCANASMIVALTKFQAQGLDRIEVDPKRVAIIPYGVAARDLPRKEPLAAPFRFLHVGYALPVKDTLTMLRTFKRVSDRWPASLTVVGLNHSRGTTIRDIESLGLGDKVDLVEYVSRADMLKFYERAHFLLQTSLYESQGVVMNEAMMCGVIVCSTRVGLAADIGDRLCLTADVGDDRGLAGKILELIDSPVRYSELRRQAYEWSREHDVRWAAGQYDATFRQLIRHKLADKL